jgi:hypothetical protein
MQELTPEGRRLLQEFADRHAVTFDAVVTLLRALIAGNGSQAQFDHPDLGGMGQWSRGGMIMVGDIFNQGLKHRVDTLCNELANLLRSQPLLRAGSGSFQSQSQGSGDASLFVQGSNSSFGRWWPADLGDPSATGAQNEMRYAYFPHTRRLAIRLGGRVSVYDTGEHLITGCSQQQSGDQSLTFTSQLGLVRLADLPLVHAGEARSQDSVARIFSTPEPSQSPNSPMSPPRAPTTASAKAQSTISEDPRQSSGTTDILSTIDRLAQLRDKGALTEEEFVAAKSSLLSRL